MIEETVNEQEEVVTQADASATYYKGLKKDLDVLRKTPAFQNLILVGYMQDKAVDGVSMLAHPSVIQNNQRTELMESLIAISRLQDFFNTVDSLGAENTQIVEEEDGETVGLQPGDSL